MKGKSHVTLEGNIGSVEDQLRYTKAKRPVRVFTMAVNKDYADVKRTNWYRVNVLDADGAFPFNKGMAVKVDGELTVADYVNKDGVAKYSLDVLTDINNVREVVFDKATDEEIPF